MEAVLGMPSPDRGRDFVVPLSLGGVRVRAVVHSGNQLASEISREPADCVLLPELLPDGPAELWLTKVSALSARRPLAIVLVYGVEAVETVRERVRAAYGPAADVVAAGARNVDDVSAEVCRVVERLARVLAEQDMDAFERLRQPVPTGQVPQPVRKGGAVAFLGASGGVGTSTLVANLAVYAAMAGQRVLVVDAHFATGGTILYHLGAEPDDVNRGIHHVRWTHMSTGGTARDSASEELIRRTEEVRLRGVRHAELRVLHAPAILEQMSSIPADLVLWAVQALERSFDLVLFDCGSGVGDLRTQRLLEQAGRIFLVAGGWGTSVHALVRGLTALDGKQNDRIFLLLRESEGAYGTRTVRSLANMPIFGRVPEEPIFRKQEARLGARLPVAAEEPESSYARAIAELAFGLGIVDQAASKKASARRGLRALFGTKSG
ncbi:MAG TPA: AAA family ATPase [Symbiobacteriaceae bacterium]|nr:AAA family ATPase [Symbiobacteriaceae bacterium]